MATLRHTMTALIILTRERHSRCGARTTQTHIFYRRQRALTKPAREQPRERKPSHDQISSQFHVGRGRSLLLSHLPSTLWLNRARSFSNSMPPPYCDAEASQSAKQVANYIRLADRATHRTLNNTYLHTRT